MGANLELVRATYEGSSEENGKNLLIALASDAEWTEAAGFPYAGTYKGVENIISGVFNRLATEWTGYNAKVHTFLEDGDRVAAFGIYSGTFNATGKSFSATFAHLYTIKDGKIIRMEQYVDSAKVRESMQ